GGCCARFGRALLARRHLRAARLSLGRLSQRLSLWLQPAVLSAPLCLCGASAGLLRAAAGLLRAPTAGLLSGPGLLCAALLRAAAAGERGYRPAAAGVPHPLRAFAQQNGRFRKGTAVFICRLYLTMAGHNLLTPAGRWLVCRPMTTTALKLALRLIRLCR